MTLNAKSEYIKTIKQVEIAIFFVHLFILYLSREIFSHF